MSRETAYQLVKDGVFENGATIIALQWRGRQHADNAKKKAQIAELQQFVSRFSANASKAKQATSRARQIDKIKLGLQQG